VAAAGVHKYPANGAVQYCDVNVAEATVGTTKAKFAHPVSAVRALTKLITPPTTTVLIAAKFAAVTVEVVLKQNAAVCAEPVADVGPGLPAAVIG